MRMTALRNIFLAAREEETVKGQQTAVQRMDSLALHGMPGKVSSAPSPRQETKQNQVQDHRTFQDAHSSLEQRNPMSREHFSQELVDLLALNQGSLVPASLRQDHKARAGHPRCPFLAEGHATGSSARVPRRVEGRDTQGRKQHPMPH